MLAYLLPFVIAATAIAQIPQPTRRPLHATADLNVGESLTVELPEVGGRLSAPQGPRKSVQLKLIDLKETRDPLRGAVRSAEVIVEVDGTRVTLGAAQYRLPVTVASVQVDCAVTKGYTSNSRSNVWALDKDARIRVWPAGSPLVEPGTFLYPARQRWFATATQMANEPVFVDGGEKPSVKTIYYHYGLDIGGSEGLVDVVAATDGIVVSSGTAVLPGYKNTPVAPRYDVVYILDARGWFYRYSHLKVIDKAIVPGADVKMGAKVGVLGKEGASGGWSHLHFDVSKMQPSGRYGIEDGYAFLWDAYAREFKPSLVAVARPHHFVRTGDTVLHDGSRSWSADKIVKHEWLFGDGSTAPGPIAKRTYDKPGNYSEVLRVTDSAGRVEYDFAIVQVIDAAKPDELPPSIHANYAPTFANKAGQPITFKVRTFRTTDGQETWNFGDGSPEATTKSDGCVKPLAPDGYAVIEHTFAKPGTYVVRVSRTDARGATATAHLCVRIE